MAAFKNDGSFLEMFQKMQQEQAAKAAADQAKQVAAKVLAEAQSRSAAAKTDSTSQGPTPGTSNVKIPMSRPPIKPAGLGLAGDDEEDDKPDAPAGNRDAPELEHVPVASRPIKAPADTAMLAEIEKVAGMVAKGETTSEEHRSQHPAEPVLSFLDVDSLYHTFYLKRLEHFRIAQEAFAAAKVAAQRASEEGAGKKRSRWDTSADDIKAAQEQYAAALTQAYETMQEMENPQKRRKKRGEDGYDSDEEERHARKIHESRIAEMAKTAEEAKRLTEAARGKHHLGDFLPKEELEKFMRKAAAIRAGKKTWDDSEYQEHKITEDNKGYQMLAGLGWTEGQGLGASNQGITAPVNKNASYTGLGVQKPDDIQEDDDEFSLYRKRMMLAYRFRPNPLNNPRRPYY